MTNQLISKIKFSPRKEGVLIISALVAMALLIRIGFTSYDIPLLVDALDYYLFAYHIITEWNFPKGILPTNDGWSLLLTFFFMFFRDTDFMTLNALQKTLGSIISVITIIPVFYICRQFVSKKLAIIGSSLFIFDPRILQNSTLGITEPLYIFLSSLILVTIFKNDTKLFYITFMLVGLCSIVRYEGLIMLVPISIIYFIKFGKSKNSIKNFSIALLVFLIVVSPIVFLRTSTNGMDGLTSHLFTGVQDYFSLTDEKVDGGSYYEDSSNNHIMTFGSNSIFNTLKYFAWISIPLFVCFLPFGIYKIIKHKNKEMNYLLLLSVFIIIPALYAYGREFQDPRYLFALLPVLCVISVYGIDKIGGFARKFWIILLIIIILTSFIILFYTHDDQTLRKEKYLVSKIVINTATGVNYYDGSTFLKSAELEVIWPKPLPIDVSEDEIGKPTLTLANKIPYGNAQNIEEYILNSRSQNLSHLVIYENNDKNFLDQIFSMPEDYPYLKLEFDSNENNFENKILIYKINYEKFDNYVDGK